MNKPILIFLSGTVFGIVASMLMPSGSIKSNSGEFEKITAAVDELNNTTKNLKELIQAYTYVLPENSPSTSSNTHKDIPSKQTQKQPTNQGSLTANAIQDSLINTPTNIQLNQAPATPIQITQYQSIEEKLYQATNNHGLILSDLVEEANDLTPQQRKDLTKQVMGMINRGELKPKQFTSKPGT